MTSPYLHQAARQGPHASDISRWLERYSLMAAVISTRFPHKAGELFAYQAMIVRVERNYEGKRWVTYDRREALARKYLNWSITDPCLYNEAFTGRARAITRCSFCLQDDHVAAHCPKNPHRPMFGWFPDPGNWTTSSQGQSQPRPYLGFGQRPELCRRFNEEKCRYPKCKYRHACSDSQGTHPLIECPHSRATTTRVRSRSPQRALLRPSFQQTGLPQARY